MLKVDSDKIEAYRRGETTELKVGIAVIIPDLGIMKCGDRKPKPAPKKIPKKKATWGMG